MNHGASNENGILLKNSCQEIGYCVYCNTTPMKDYKQFSEHLEIYHNTTIAEIVKETKNSFSTINDFIKKEMIEIDFK
ncbi:MAG: hypothetical protein CVV02_05635 [Firmicutes bacterium HGW-Firmicutes-7]|nr:MAG: hypothetical protein CVV02_05635 [Firmicutes bacterium HGW-Firmicutes-7]